MVAARKIGDAPFVFSYSYSTLQSLRPERYVHGPPGEVRQGKLFVRPDCSDIISRCRRPRFNLCSRVLTLSEVDFTGGQGPRSCAPAHSAP